MKSLGFPVGKKWMTLKIPENFTDKNIKNVIAGFFATDGSFVLANNNGTKYPRLEIQNKSYKILEQTKEFLEKTESSKVFVIDRTSIPRYRIIQRLKAKKRLAKIKTKSF